MNLEPFLATYTGGRFYPFGPDPDRIDIRDIAHALSNVCRFAGHTSHFWSVAAHSLVVSARVERWWTQTKSAGFTMSKGHTDRARLALTALLHDASEAYLLDVPKPIKPLFLNYEAWEENASQAVAQKFNLIHPVPAIVKEYDGLIVLDEVATFFEPKSAAWARYGITDRTRHDRLFPLDPKTAERRFLARFEELTK